MTRAWLFTTEGRLRAVWRIALFLLACIAGTFVAVALTGMLEQSGALFGLRLIVYPLAYVGGFLLAHGWMLRKVDHRDWSFVGLQKSALDPGALLTATALGALAILLPVAALTAVGLFEVRSMPDGSWSGTALRAAALLLPAAFYEELLTRGYIFAVLREAAGWKWAMGITSAVFALLHLANPDATLQSITVVLLAGVFLGAVLLVTGSLYAATAAHFAWNWVIAATMHMDVSGFPIVGSPDYRVVETGPDWITGGGWGPEGGLAAAVGLSSALVVLALIARRRPTPSGVSSNG